jgi:hypothetical protein
MFIPDPDFYPSRIPGPTTAPKENGGKKIFRTIFVATNIIAITLRIIILFNQKFVIKISKIWVWDPGSGIRKREKPRSPTLLLGSSPPPPLHPA